MDTLQCCNERRVTDELEQLAWSTCSVKCCLYHFSCNLVSWSQFERRGPGSVDHYIGWSSFSVCLPVLSSPFLLAPWKSVTPRDCSPAPSISLGKSPIPGLESLFLSCRELPGHLDGYRDSCGIRKPHSVKMLPGSKTLFSVINQF